MIALLVGMVLAGERGTCGGDGPAIDAARLDSAMAWAVAECELAVGGSIEPAVDAVEQAIWTGADRDIEPARGALWRELVCADHVLEPVEAARVHLAHYQVVAYFFGLDHALPHAQAAVSVDALLPIPEGLQSRRSPLASTFDLAIELARSSWPECLSLGARGRTAWVDGRRAAGVRAGLPAIVQWRRGSRMRTAYLWPAATAYVFPDGAIPAAGGE